MRITYNVLWVEDDNSWYETTKELFSDTLEDLGFVLNSIRCKSIADVKAEVEANGLIDCDLLLVDFTLSDSESGDKIIDFIRNIEQQPILTEVLFYSSAVEKVRESMQKLGLEGVYTADRRDIESKFERVVNTTLKKVQEVNTMRGLIMAETSDLDELMVEIIQKTLKMDISPQIAEYVNNKIGETIESTTNLASNENVNKKVSDSRIFTSLNKAKTITQLYKLKTIGVKGFAHDYDKDIIATRNLFAHVTESIEDGEKVLVSHITGKKEIFNEDRCIQIRKDLIKYRGILEDIKYNIA